MQQNGSLVSQIVGEDVKLPCFDECDLLGRPQRCFDVRAIRHHITGRRVLITGAGGTIGTELCRTIATLDPALMVLVDNSELSLYQLDLELFERRRPVRYQVVFCDVRDRPRVETVVAETRPEMVFHAAALKHISLVEHSPTEGVLTNIGGTRNIADVCSMQGVAEVVLLSSDKAVNPSNIMGVTKRVAEIYVQALQTRGRDTRFAIVRLGNVLNSSGSVVPLFQRQIARGGPITVRHPDVCRYFMTKREAVHLVLQAAVLLRDGKAGPSRLLALDMGQPILISELARRMIHDAGLHPDADIEIVYTGLDPGEKLQERIFHEEELLLPNMLEGILVASARALQPTDLEPMLKRLLTVACAHETSAVRRALAQIVPEFSP